MLPRPLYALPPLTVLRYRQPLLFLLSLSLGRSRSFGIAASSCQERLLELTSLDLPPTLHRVTLHLGGMHPCFLVAARDGGDLARGRELFGNTGGIIAGAGRLRCGLGRQGVRGMR